MASYDVRLFSVARPVKGEKPKEPTELEPLTVKAASVDKAKVALIEKLTKAGHNIRSVMFGPNKAGLPALVAYVWEQVSDGK